MSRSVQTATATASSGAIALTRTCAAGEKIIGFTCKFSSAPTTAGSLTITLDAVAGSAYDTVLFSVDPSTTSATSLSWWPGDTVRLKEGDAVVVAYANADNRTYGAQIYYDAQAEQ